MNNLRLTRTTFSFRDTIAKISATEIGKEAAMYGPLRDIFVNICGYPAADVDIDVTGEGGRPDITVRAPSGLVDRAGAAVKIPWIVLEAKDEKVFLDQELRENIFAEKSKYIGTNTAWFVMVDPTVFVARRIGATDGAAADIIVPFSTSLTSETFLSELFYLQAKFAGVSEQLKRFREGDVSLIAVEKLTKPEPQSADKKEIARFRVTRKRFYANLREGTQHLQDACLYTLTGLQTRMDEIVRLRDEFRQKYAPNGFVEFDRHTLALRGSPSGRDEKRSHDKEVRALRKRFAREPHVARLALDDLPAFQARTGVEREKLVELFAIETANLILTRVLLLRFFEDHGFFGERRYVCNGGVEAFQHMRQYFAASYMHLLERAYAEASRLYAAAFDETELDWVFGSEDRDLSTAIEWTLFQFARYDFRTVKGDILTGIYDRFMDRDKRKEMGEFYTPPSIARYIVHRLGIKFGDRIFDPACGSGTFLIEAYREVVGREVERGVADFDDVVDTLGDICGNDLNTFSSVLAQIQLLWQILGFKTPIESHGFPDLPITSRVNSLVIPDMYRTGEEFGALDVPEYAAVLGNPPYVRRERSAQELDKPTKDWFGADQQGFPGISAELNAYALFVYRALSSWCRAAVSGETEAGKLGFIVPVSLFDANETRELRRLFHLTYAQNSALCEAVC